MNPLYQGRLWVYYHQAYVGDPEHYAEMDECFEGQTNGMCGASSPGSLHLTTGLHCDDVHLTLDVLLAAPPLDLATWEEIMEMTFTAIGRPVYLYNWNRDIVCTLPLPAGTNRVRYCARGMERGRELDTLTEAEPVDSYALAFWPAPPAPDAIL